MFRRHFDDHVRHGHGGFGRGPFHRWRERGGGMGRREGRMFDGGELRLAILALVAEKPRYGYEIIKELGERVGGEYSPSPGVVYPTLTMLEEMGYASASQDPQGRKLYTLTGRARRSSPTTRLRSTPFSPGSATATRGGSRASSRSSGRCSTCAPRSDCACAAAPRRLSRSRRSSTRSTPRRRRSSGPEAARTPRDRSFWPRGAVISGRG